MAPEIKITYFDVPGRAEAVRLVLTIGNVPFEDERITPEEWMMEKFTTPYQAVPIMTTNGKTIAQSVAMTRYAGKISGLYPKDALQAAYVDEVIDTVSELSACAARSYGFEEEALKADREKMIKDDLPRYGGGLEKRLEEMGPGPFALGDTVTIADVSIFMLFVNTKSGNHHHIPTDVLDSYSRLFQIYKSVSSIPEVKHWYSEHPVENVTIE